MSFASTAALQALRSYKPSMRRWAFVGALLCVGTVPFPAPGQVPQTGWQLGFGPPDLSIEAIVSWQGEWVVAGSITSADGQPVHHVARWDGTAWHPLGSGMNLPVRALSVWNGNLIAGGDFTIADGRPMYRIARWNGQTWQPVGTGFHGASSSSRVLALGEYDGQLIACGSGLWSSITVARFDGTNWWSMYSDGFAASEATTYQGDLIIGGEFTYPHPKKLCIRWDGSHWTDMTAGLNAPLGALAVWNGQLVVAGGFTAASSGPVNHVVAWSDSMWIPLGNGLDGFVECLLVLPDGRLLAGGSFVHADSTISHVEAWDGNMWTAVGSAFTVDSGSVRALAASENALVAGGSFRTIAIGTPPPFWRWDGMTWQGAAGLAGGNGLSGPVSALTYFRGALVAAGTFGISRWDGSTWLRLATTPLVNVLAVHEDRLVAGGNFTAVDGVSANRIASWDGSAWSPVGAGFDRPVHALAVFEGDLIAGGEFTDSGGNLTMKIARWNGVSWQHIGFGFDSTVYCLTLQDNTLVAGGMMGYASVPLYNHIARWNGSSWENIGSGLGPAMIRDVVVLSGELFASGTMPGSISRWNGSTWTTPQSGVNGTVRAMAPFGNGLLVGGDFSSAGGSPASNVALWTGSTWEAFDQGTDRGIEAIAAREHEFFVGGSLLSVGAYPASYIARWVAPRTSDVVSTPPVRQVFLAHWPNPCNPATQIRFDPVREGSVVLAIYDVTGGFVRALVRGVVPARPQQVLWDGTDAAGHPVPSGVYVCRLESAGGTATRKLTLLR